MEKEIKAVVLAAGKSKRMKSDFSKLVHKILGKEIINYLLDSLIETGIKEDNIILVVGDNRGEIEKAVTRKVHYAVQEKQLGTAHALLSAHQLVENFTGELLVTVGDNPYITVPELKKLIAAHHEKKPACTFLSAVFPDVPPPYGRVIRETGSSGSENGGGSAAVNWNTIGSVLDVVEEIDASPQQLAIREVNSSIYIFDNPVAFPLLYDIDNKNAKGEYYLTDIVKLLKKHDHPIFAVPAEDYRVSIGINNKWELQEAQEKFNRDNLQRLAVEEGVIILQPSSVTIETNVEIGRDTVIYPSTYLASGTRIGKNCRIGPFVFLQDITIPDNETVTSRTV